MNVSLCSIEVESKRIRTFCLRVKIADVSLTFLFIVFTVTFSTIYFGRTTTIDASSCGRLKKTSANVALSHFGKEQTTDSKWLNDEKSTTLLPNVMALVMGEVRNEFPRRGKKSVVLTRDIKYSKAHSPPIAKAFVLQ